MWDMPVSTRSKIATFYHANPHASLDDVLQHLGRRKTPALLRMIVEEQSKLRQPRPATGLKFVGLKHTRDTSYANE